MSLLFRTHYRLAKDSLRRSKPRAFLTCLGIAIGVASIILILSLMGSINRLISDQVKSVGNDLIVVRPTTHKDVVDSIVSELTSSNQFMRSNLTLADVDIIKNLDTVSAAAPIAISTNTIQGEKTVESGSVLGTTADLLPILNLSLKSGNFISDPKKDTPEDTPKTSVIGRDLSLELFGTTESVGRTLSVQGTKFLITGVLSRVEDPINFNNVDFDRTLILPVNYLKSLDDTIQIQQINAKVTTTDALADTATTINSSLKDAKSGDTNFSTAYGDQISHPAGSLFSIVSSMLTLVAGISLIVGGIGVMNIMLVAVAERTHEIGIRKAVGATNTNIFLQFLFESLILCFLGSLLGLALGYAFAFLLSIITPFTPFISWQILLAVVYISIVVGTLFGLYPAIKASRKHPIDSLNSY